MNHKSAVTMNNSSLIGNIFNWLFGILVFAIGVVNTFWGNDFAFGIFIILLSLVYLLPVNSLLENLTGLSIPRLWLWKIILGIFILVASLGVGELFGKLALMGIGV